jgi:hypothetical protein
VSTFARRAATVGAITAAVTVAMTGAASAAVPDGWSNPSHVNGISWLLVLLIVPVGAALVISFLVLLPGIMRGEGLVPRAARSNDVQEQRRGHH